MSEEKTVKRTLRSGFCPECGRMAIASEMGMETVIEQGRPRPGEARPFEVDSHWCDTPGCKHNHDTGEPFGTGLRFSA